MIWIDYGFDYSDQLARKYMKYKGEYYDVGTVCVVKGPYGPRLVKFVGWKHGDRGCFKLLEDEPFGLYDTYNRAGVMDYCLEIVTPVKPELDQETIKEKGGYKTPKRNKPPSWEVEVAWVWYIFIMAIATIFNARLLIWGVASAAFFLWKSGFLSGGNKK